MAQDKDIRWIVRLTPPEGRTVRDLLEIPLSLDVWEREPGALIAAVAEPVLREMERRRLAGVERLCTTAEHEARVVTLGRSGP